jgi:hypothetical protein
LSIHGNQLRFAFKEIPATFVRKCEWTRRKEDGMTVELEEFTKEFRAQRSMLQALHITQNEHTAALRKLETGQEELRRGQKELWQGQQELWQGQAKVLAGVQTIIGLLGRDIDTGNESGDG